MQSKMLKMIFIILTSMVITAGTLIYFIFFHTTNNSPKQTWFSDINGYQRALLETELTDSPILLYIRRKNCHLCRAFEKEYFNHPMLEHTLASFTKVKIIINDTKTSELFAKQFKSQSTPSLFVLYDENHPVSTYLILETSQIWVVRQGSSAGNFMPLSPASFQLALQGARWHAYNKVNSENQDENG